MRIKEVFCLTILCGIGIYFIQGQQDPIPEREVTNERYRSKGNDLVYRTYDENVIEIGEKERIRFELIWNHVGDGERVYLYCYETEEERELFSEKKETVLENLQPGTYQIYAKTQAGKVKNLSQYAAVEQAFQI